MQVPRYEDSQVKITPLSMPQAQAAPAGSFGEGIAKGLGDVANAGMNIAAHENQLAQQEKEKQDKAVAAKAEIALIGQFDKNILESSQVTGRAVTPDHDEDGQPQPGAPDLVTQYSTDFRDQRAEIEKNLTEDQKKLFVHTADRYELGLNKHLMKHQVEQTEAWQTEQHATLAATISKSLESVTTPALPVEDLNALYDQTQLIFGKVSTEKADQEYDRIVETIEKNRVENAIKRGDFATAKLLYDAAVENEHIDPNGNSGSEATRQIKAAEIHQKKIIVAEQHDVIFKDQLLPALTNKTYIAPMTATPTYQKMAELDPAMASTVTKNAEHFNASLAMDKFDTFMTGVKPSATMTFAQVPQEIRADLKQYNPAAYNRLKEQFNAERIMRAEKAAADKANKNDASALMIQALINPSSIDQHDLVKLIQTGGIDAKLGMKILENAQKGGNVEDKLRAPGLPFARVIDDEAEYMVSGVAEKNRPEAKKRVIGTLYDALVPAFKSQIEVTPDAVQALLTRMRRATVEEIGRGQVYSLGITKDTNVRIPKLFRQQAEQLAEQRGITPGQAWGILSATHAIGQQPLTTRGGVK